MQIPCKTSKYSSALGAVAIYATLAALQFGGRAESPIVGTVNDVNGEAKVQDRKGEIIPLIWRARIGSAVTSIPLSGIEHYGIQDYILDGVARVRELTVTTKSRSMVRIYHITPLGKGHVVNRLEELKKVAGGLSDQDDDLPIKTYPTTTHEKMVEYRVSDVSDIGTLFKSLDKTMVVYLGRELVPSQRELVATEVTVNK